MAEPRKETAEPELKTFLLIVGLGKAIELAVTDIPSVMPGWKLLRNRLIDGILSTVENTRLNGHPIKRLAGNVNFSFEFIEGEALLLSLDIKESPFQRFSLYLRFLDPSHVLLAIGLSHEIAHGSLRLTLVTGIQKRISIMYWKFFLK